MNRKHVSKQGEPVDHSMRQQEDRVRRFVRFDEMKISHRYLGKIPVGKGAGFWEKEVSKKLTALISQTGLARCNRVPYQ